LKLEISSLIHLPSFDRYGILIPQIVIINEEARSDVHSEYTSH